MADRKDSPSWKIINSKIETVFQKRHNFGMDSRRNQNDELFSEKSQDFQRAKCMLFGWSSVNDQKAM